MSNKILYSWHHDGNTKKTTFMSHANHTRRHCENVIKADVILSAWLNYCRQSRLYRLLEWFGLR